MDPPDVESDLSVVASPNSDRRVYLDHLMRTEFGDGNPMPSENLALPFDELVRSAQCYLEFDDAPVEPHGSQEASSTKEEAPSWRPTLAGCMSIVLFFGGFIGFWYAVFVGTPHKVAHAHGSSHLPDLLSYGIVVLMTGTLVWRLKAGHAAEAFALARQVTLAVVGQNLIIVALTASLALVLVHVFPALDRSWLYLLPGHEASSGNIAAMPMQIKYFGIVYVLLFAVNIPRMARSEEISYREGTRDWRHGAVRSLRFGLGHCMMGVPLFVGLALSIGGLWFTYQYFQGGVDRSTLHHATYNWIIATLALVVVTMLSIAH